MANKIICLQDLLFHIPTPVDYILHVTESPQMSFRNWWEENPDFFSSDVFHQLAVPTQSREEGIWNFYNEKNSGGQIQLQD